ncbi:twin-arginine translocase subunit TatC [Candidatus Saccharibacteria bacterium]|nr:MAG: twin-arginine translocase subunit TatC [Candidatus Saccharibacteria bacterium]
MDHVYELRGRLFWIAVIFLVGSAAAYPYYHAIIDFLVAPLGNQKLYYLTPVGGFSFIIKVCTYVGMVLTLPAAIYHLYKYLQPVVGQVKGRVVLGYVLFSLLLAIGGTAFAYYVILPAALHFLTNFDVKDVTAMLTVDSYLSFVITYLLGAAVLFQLPIVLLIINAITPLSPKGLMKYQRYVLLGAFVAAAIISPTPDITNQTLLAVPIIIMYQLGIILIWIRNAFKKSPKKAATPALQHGVAKKGRGKQATIFEIKQPPFKVHVTGPPLPARIPKQPQLGMSVQPAVISKPAPLYTKPVGRANHGTVAPAIVMKPQPVAVQVGASAATVKAQPMTRTNLYGRPQPAPPQRAMRSSYVSPAMRQAQIGRVSSRSVDGLMPSRQIVIS